MPIISAPHELTESDVYIDLEPHFGHQLHLKCEGFNFGGSVKLRVAAGLVAAAERDGLLRPGSVLVESSSGNLGIALSAIAASKGLRFVCVTDSRCNPMTVRLMRALGAQVRIVDQPHPESGFLGARLDLVRRLCAADSNYLWLNQYENEANWGTHFETTAAEIVKTFPRLDVLFVGTGTGGTVMGCARHLRAIGASTRVVAVDAVGSVTFGAPAATRLIPGLGAGVVPPMVDRSVIDDVLHVAEIDTVRACRALSGRGFLLGGSSGTVLAGALSWLDTHDPTGSLTSVAIAPDLGERYLDTIYDDSWVLSNYGPSALEPLPRRVLEVSR